MTQPRAGLLADLLTDLLAEGEDLDALVAPLSASPWRAPTPAGGWSRRDAVVHLHRSDLAGLAALAGRDLAPHVPGVLTPADDGDDAGLLAAWRQGRRALATALGAQPPGVRIPWFGPPMGLVSFASARLMETWAHGQDIADSLGVRREPTDRLRHVAELGVRTRGWSYAVRGATPPAGPVRVELAAPSGAMWTWGPDDAEDRVTGSALSFCLLVTQRRHRDDLPDLRTEGAGARGWLRIAQAYAGAPGPGRPPGAPTA